MAAAFLVALVAMVMPPGALAAKPKPWQWTNQRAAAKIVASRGYLDMGRVTSAKCAGVGKQTPPRSGRYSSFACTVSSETSGTRRIWLRTRPAPGEAACVSFAGLGAITPLCLRARGLTPGANIGPSGFSDLVRFATAERFTGTRSYWTGFRRVSCVGMDGYLECTFEGDVSGRAAVLMRTTGPEVVFLDLTCVGAYAGRTECVVSP